MSVRTRIVWDYSPAPEATDHVRLKDRYGLFLDGEFREPADGRYQPTINPATEEPIAEIAWAGPGDIETAVQSAGEAQPKWAALKPLERAKYLFRIARLIQERSRELAVVETMDGGKPLRESRDVDIPLAAAHFFHYAGWADKLRYGVNAREVAPLGVVGQIVPWNFPLLMAAWKLAPALACGNAAILKPAETTPLTALLLAEVTAEAGLPNGWLSVVCGPANDIGDVLVEDERVRALTFTGSGPVGWGLRRRAARKRVALELGNSTPMIIAADADLERAASIATATAFSYSGQTCISLQRIYVDRSVHDEFVRLLVPKVEELVVGDPADERTDVGPVIDERSRDRILDWIVRSGGTILTGGTLTGDGLIRPTVISSPADDSELSCAEAFGPVCTVQPFDDVEDAFRRANATPYGLQAGIFTADISLALRAVRALEFGGVVVNDAPSIRVDHMPYGGIKASGNTREGPRYAAQEFSDERLVVVQL